MPCRSPDQPQELAVALVFHHFNIREPLSMMLTLSLYCFCAADDGFGLPKMSSLIHVSMLICSAHFVLSMNILDGGNVNPIVRMKP